MWFNKILVVLDSLFIEQSYMIYYVQGTQSKMYAVVCGPITIIYFLNVLLILTVVAQGQQRATVNATNMALLPTQGNEI